jgi:hypothetical protein
MSARKWFWLPLLLAGCMADGADDGGPSPFDDGQYPVSDWGSLLGDAPDNDSLPLEGKADEVYPAEYAEILEWQSPVKSQGSRGVCSIFSTVALMEHLYIKAGFPTEPDFSEQYLQWSVKFEVGSFPRSSGSNAMYNLRAISDYGIVDEVTYPYQPREWGVSDDPECDGEDDAPTRCYTNGEPPDEVRNATKYTLPRGRWLNSRSIKSHMTSRKTAVVVGMTFFYQSWNHRSSQLPVNSEYWRKGYVLYPNAEDKTKSLEKRAGHSILLVGWDDELEVPTVDENGDVITDADGNPVVEKGFYIFKNSWGTGSFGVENPHGDGYGFISQRYVHEYGSSYVSDLPDVEVPVEDCGNGIDDTGNGDIDCDDSACTEAPECQGGTEVLTYTGDGAAIPDNDPVGISSTITAADDATIGALVVHVDITHTYRGDLRVVLYRGDESVVLHDREGGYQDDLKTSYTVTDFDGDLVTGDWKLAVSDHAAYDTGTLETWSLEVLTR